MRAVVVVSMLYLGLCEGQVVTFDLTGYKPENETSHVQKTFINLTEGISEVWVENIPDDVGFFVIQIHSSPYNVTLSYSHKIKSKNSVGGTNVGLFSFEKTDAVFYVKTKNVTTALIAIVIYTAKDPIPGGCNLSFDTEYAPYQRVFNTDDLIIVESQAPSALNNFTCDKNNIQVDLYHLFLHENSYEPSYYFNGVENMLTVDLIKAHGTKVSTVDGYFKYRKLYSNYEGVGQVFAIVATHHNRSSAYVPAVSYGCNLNDQDSCITPNSPHWKLICAFLFIFGLFVNFFGHKYFRITLYLGGLALGIYTTYVILSLSNNNLTIGEKTTTSILIGLIYGSVWLLMWWKFGSPIVSVSLTYFLAGFLMASIIFYSGVADLRIFHNDANFWLTFAAIIVAFQTIWTMKTLEGHVFGCSFLGAYACVAALNFYTGGNLQYIVINTYRRMVVENFNMATVDPPFQILDISQSILFVVMTTFGFYYQMKEQRGKPPFPPHRYTSEYEEGVSESTPLMRNSGVIYSDI